MTPAEVSQYIAEYQLKDLIPGHHQVEVKGTGAVPHRVPAQEPGYVWELVESVSTSVYEQCDYPKAYRIARPERWDSLYQYQQENQMNNTPVSEILIARIKELPPRHVPLHGRILSIKLSKSMVPLEIPDPTSGTWKLVAAERDHEFVTVSYELDRPKMYCMTVRGIDGKYVEVWDSRTTDRDSLFEKVVEWNIKADVHIGGFASDEERGLFDLRKV